MKSIIFSGEMVKAYFAADLWDSLYAKKRLGWDINPWVWVLEFRSTIAGKKG